MKEKIKALAGKLRKGVMGKAVALSMVMAAFAVPALATEGETGGAGVSVDMTAITSAFSDGINSVIQTSIQILALMLPAVLSFFAVKFVCVKGMAWFKSMASK